MDLKTRAQQVVAVVLAGVLAGCASYGPEALNQTRLHYNKVVKATTEEQLLLNIVRLRYTDTPSSLAVSAIAAQFERSQSVQIIPFFTSAGGDINRSFTAVLPSAQALGADRPTFSLTPQDDQEFTRKLFTPLPLDGIVYLAKTTWPISTVFRLYLENLNWVSNAQTASGPTPKEPPDVADFLRGIAALQLLQDRGQIVFGVENREEKLGGPLPVASVKAGDVIEAAKNGYEYRPDENGATWTLVRKSPQPVLLIDPETAGSGDAFTAASALLRVARDRDPARAHGTGPGHGDSRPGGSDLRLAADVERAVPSALCQGSGEAAGCPRSDPIPRLLVLHRRDRPGHQVHLLAVDGVGASGTRGHQERSWAGPDPAGERALTHFFWLLAEGRATFAKD